MPSQEKTTNQSCSNTEFKQYMKKAKPLDGRGCLCVNGLGPRSTPTRCTTRSQPAPRRPHHHHHTRVPRYTNTPVTAFVPHSHHIHTLLGDTSTIILHSHHPYLIHTLLSFIPHHSLCKHTRLQDQDQGGAITTRTPGPTPRPSQETPMKSKNKCLLNT